MPIRPNTLNIKDDAVFIRKLQMPQTSCISCPRSRHAQRLLVPTQLPASEELEDRYFVDGRMVFHLPTPSTATVKARTRSLLLKRYHSFLNQHKQMIIIVVWNFSRVRVINLCPSTKIKNASPPRSRLSSRSSYQDSYVCPLFLKKGPWRRKLAIDSENGGKR